jgi:glycosyltransferase involved in cell wall biosynthesis
LNSRNGFTIFQNERDAALFADRGLVKPDRYAVIASSGVDVDRFYPNPEPSGIPIVLLAARMLWDKGVGELVEAARILSRRGDTGKVVLAGDVDPGNPATIERNQLREWEREGVIEWWGHQEDMPAILARCQVVVLPSYGEGISRSLIEAAAAGKPIVASDVPGCREVVIDGQNGILVPPKDSDALAKAIGQLLGDPALRARMGQAGREIAVERFSDKLVNAQTLEAYSALLGKDRVPAAT